MTAEDADRDSVGFLGEQSQSIAAKATTDRFRPAKFVFELSKLRVRFNKESRKRRLITAEMDQTNAQYSHKVSGGMKADATVGNLTLVDPSGEDGETLYSQILGLKTDGLSKDTSLWKMKYESFTRGSEDEIAGASDDMRAAKIDRENGRVDGVDSRVELAFSPMRFVYLQQLWLEMADYFFEGILGDAVWGRPTTSDKTKSVMDDTKQLFVSQSSDGIPGIDADGIRFLRFIVSMEAPLWILPVSYRSPQHMRLSLKNMSFRNHHSGQLEESPVQSGVGTRMQWFNNCDVTLEDVSLTDWEGIPLLSTVDSDDGLSRAPHGRVAVRWPLGPFSPLVVPKWNVNVAVDPVQFRLRRADYALFQHIVWYNVGEESRHLDEWNAMQTLSAEELKEYKKRVLVHFGYDKKDGPPSTFHVKIHCDRFIIRLASIDSSSNKVGIGLVDCEELDWSLRKVSDRISRQRLTCGGITLAQKSGKKEYEGFKKLLLPLQDDASEAGQFHPELVYESTSRPSGDNVKYLLINDGCIYFIYGAWMEIKSFFTGVPNPDVMTKDEVKSSMQIGDRWYRIGGETKSDGSIFSMNPSPVDLPKRLYQFRLVLASPRIVLVADPSQSSCQALTMRLSHMDYLYVNNQSKGEITRGILIDGLELFTGLAAAPTKVSNLSSETSLLHPLCLEGVINDNYGAAAGKDLRLVCDVVRARCAYTDMSLAADAALALMYDVRQYGQKHSATTHAPVSKAGEAKDILKTDKKESELNGTPPTRVSACCPGFELIAIDDSFRHFANAQKLIELVMGEMRFDRGPSEGDASKLCTFYRLKSLVLRDHLHSTNSRFHRILSTNQMLGISNSGEVSCNPLDIGWDTHSMIVDPIWGYKMSSSLLSECNASRNIARASTSDWMTIDQLASDLHKDIFCRSEGIEMQWNPSTIIALQRFLGRFNKATQTKLIELRRLLSNDSATKEAAGIGVGSEGTKASSSLRLSMDKLSIRLNKENQNRRLLEARVSETNVSFLRNEHGSFQIQGYIGDVCVRDTDTVSPLCERNISLLQVLTEGDEKFLSFLFRTFKTGKSNEPFPSNQLASNHQLSPSKLPNWVEEASAESERIDSFVSVRMASLQMIYLKDRTAEIMDYLSNGLPGKSMGFANRAAKEVIKETIKTQNILELSIATPHVFIPQHRESSFGLSVQLGQLSVKSWFEEKSLEGVKNTPCTQSPGKARVQNTESNASTPPEAPSIPMDWWRTVSLQISGLGMKVSNPRAVDSSVPIPVNLQLLVFNPSWYSNTLVLRGNLSHVEQSLKYTNYIFIKEVIKDNIGKPVDKSSWDNIGYSRAKDDHSDNGLGLYRSVEVQYAPDARLIRYGHANEKGIEDDTQISSPPSEDDNMDDSETSNVESIELSPNFLSKPTLVIRVPTTSSFFNVPLSFI